MTTDMKSWLSEVGKRIQNIGKIIRTEAAKAAPVIPQFPGSDSPRMSELELWTELERMGWPIEQPAAAEKKARSIQPSEKPAEVGSGAVVSVPEPKNKNQAEPLLESRTERLELPIVEPQHKEPGASPFQNLKREVLNEVFSSEDLQELEKLKKDETHIYSSEKINQAAGISPDTVSDDTRVKRKKKPAAEADTELAEDTEDTTTERDFRPIRRKRYYRTGLRGGLMYFGFVVCISVILASVGWLAADDMLSLNKEYAEADVYVSDPVDIEQVGTELANKGLIRYKFLFRLFGKLTDADTKIDPGTYTLSTKLDYNAMIQLMEQHTDTTVARETVTVMIPEGKTLKQTFQILAERGVCPYETLLECSANYEFKYDFLEDLPYGTDTRLEGYLFPDTYQFFVSSSPEDAISRFLDNYAVKMTADMRQKCADMGYSIQEIMTIASLIEMEAGTDTERATISSVIYNRLASSYYPYLQIDATVQYVLEERKESLTYADLEVDSPYNTYKYTGLPPGPIANPGLASIRAALNPEYTGYYFYALNKDGKHEFFSTYSQFQNFKNSSEFGG